MTRKHFRDLAEALARTRPLFPEDRGTWRQVRDAIADVCALYNRNFDRNRFYAATEED